MPNEIYPISHFGKSTDDGFGSIYHHYTNAIEQPEEPIVVVPPIGVVPAEPVVVVPIKPLEPIVIVPLEPEEPIKKKLNNN